MTPPGPGRRPKLLLVALVAALALWAGAPAGAGVAQEAAGETTPDLVIRAVEPAASDEVAVEFLYNGSRAAAAAAVLRVGGRTVPATAPAPVEGRGASGIVLAIDTSTSMQVDGAFDAAVDAARSFVAAKRPSDQVAIVTFGGAANVRQPFTADADELREALGRLTLADGTALYDGLRAAADLFEPVDLSPYVVLLTDGRDAGSATSADEATALLREHEALLLAIGLGDPAQHAPVGRIATATGGVLAAAGVDDLEAVYADLQQTLRQRYRTTFSAADAPVPGEGAVEVALTIGGDRADGRWIPEAAAAVVEPVVPSRSGIGALQAGWALWLGVALAVAAVAAALYGVLSLLVSDRPRLDAMLSPYTDARVEDVAVEGGFLGSSTFMRRAVAFTGEFAEQRGVLARAERMLEQADLPLRGAEVLFAWVAGVVVMAIGSLVALRNPLGTLLVVAVAALAPPALLSFQAGSRRRKFNAQLPDMLQLLSGTLRAGFSLMQGVEAAAQEVSEPMRKELQRVVTESRLGMPLETALDGVSTRMASADFEWAVMAIRIQREVGGNLAELLMTVAETMTQRERLRRDVRSLTAEGRVSAFVLGVLPLALMAMMWVINPEYIGSLFDETIGNVMLGGGIVLMVGGFAWMYKMIDIEV